jgi:hypothetical protein
VITTVQGIRCGNRAAHVDDRVYHATSADVRSCFAGATLPSPSQRQAVPQRGQNSPATRPASAGSLKYLDDLICRKEYRQRAEVNYSVSQIIKDRLAGRHLSHSEVSQAIDELKACPIKEEHAPDKAARAKLAALLEQVPNGGYAVEIAGKTHFYVVRTVHRQTGRRGVRERTSDELHRMYANQQVSALEAVLAQGLDESGRMYAQRLSMCRICHRSLTDDTGNPYYSSGYGPECGSRMLR